MTEKAALEAALEVAKPMFFASLVIITAYLPLFAFERVEKKLFTPMAFTVGYSLCGALLFALAVVPALAYLTYRRPGKTWRNPVFEWLRGKYDTFLHRMLAKPRFALYASAAAAAIALVLALTVGREFLPYLDEGSIWLQIQMPPGISIQKASDMARDFRKVMRTFPEVSYVITQTGRDDAGVDPWTFSHIESCVGLKPYDEWGGDKQALIARMDRKLNAELTGMKFGFSQPIFDMVNDMIAGAHSDLIVKIYGDDLAASRRSPWPWCQCFKASGARPTWPWIRNRNFPSFKSRSTARLPRVTASMLRMWTI